MMLTSLPHVSGFRFGPRHHSRVARAAPRPARGVLSNKTSSTQSFVQQHKEVLQDPEWYGPEEPDHPVSPAAAAAAPATAATRGDVRLISSFTKYIKGHKLDLSVLFCNESILSADSRTVCDATTGHHGELLSEFLTSGNLRVGEELPHWFVNGNLRGAIKCWMATRPAASALAEAAAAAAGGGGADAVPDDSRHKALLASVSRHAPLGTSVAPLVDRLLSAMPQWRASLVEELGGWEPSDPATAEDVAALHCFGAIVYSSRLDAAVFLQQLCGANPFSWVDAQVAGGVISEPDAWLLERFFMSRHTEGEPLPMWFAKWGVREEIGKWLGDKQAAHLVHTLLEARGFAAGPVSSSASSALDSSASDSYDAAGGAPKDARVVALDRVEAAAAALMTSALARHGGGGEVSGASIRFRRNVRVRDRADPDGASHALDLLATAEAGAATVTLLAVAVQMSYSNGSTGANVVALVRQAKEQLNWLGFLLRREGEVAPGAAVAKVVVLVEPEEGGEAAAAAAAAVAAIPPSVREYLEHHGVIYTTVSELPSKSY